MTVTTVQAPQSPVGDIQGKALSYSEEERSRVVKNLGSIEDELGSVLFEREEAIRAILVAVLARQHMVLLGPPGTAKSMLVLELAKRIGDQEGLHTFTYLLTKFTTPEELFGPISMQGLKEDSYRRVTTSRLPETELAFLDEIFKSSSAILNALLTMINERMFDNDGKRVPIPLLSLIAASNELPQGDDLSALWDRFALRVRVNYIGDDANFQRMLESHLDPSFLVPKTKMPRTDLLLAQDMVRSVRIPRSVLQTLGSFRKQLTTKHQIRASDRMWGWGLNLMRANAFLEDRMVVEEEDLGILRHCLWNEPDQEKEIAREANRLANPLSSRATELVDQAESIHESSRAVADKNASSKDQQKQMEMVNAQIEAMNKIKKVAEEMDKIYNQAASEGRSTAKIEKAREKIKAIKLRIAQETISDPGMGR